MRTVWQVLEKVKEIDAVKLMVQAMQEPAPVYIEQQKLQMYDGINSQGLAIEPEYHPFTVIEKERKGQISTHVTLKDTGDFYNAIYIENRATDFLIDSKDRKSNTLQEKYGDEIFGLDTDYKQPYLEQVQKQIYVKTVKALT
jgi:hypothetical protein